MSLNVPQTRGIESRLNLDLPLFFLLIINGFFVLYITINPSSQSLGLVASDIYFLGLILLILVKITHPKRLVTSQYYAKLAGKWQTVTDALILIALPAILFTFNVLNALFYVKGTIFNIVTDNSILIVLTNAGISETILIVVVPVMIGVWFLIEGFHLQKSIGWIPALGLIVFIVGLLALLLHTIAYQAQPQLLPFVFESFAVFAATYIITGKAWIIAVAHIEWNVIPELAFLLKNGGIIHLTALPYILGVIH